MRRNNFGRFKKIMDVHPVGASSSKMHNMDELLLEFKIEPNSTVLDLGCGPGDYSIEFAKQVSPQGKVIAIDNDDDVINYLDQRIENEKELDIDTYVADIRKTLPLKDNSVDICCIITVLHILNIRKHGNNIFNEIRRVLKPGGRLITIDVKKEDYDFGPPISMKISNEQLEPMVEKVGFTKESMIDLTYNYMLKFNLEQKDA